MQLLLPLLQLLLRKLLLLVGKSLHYTRQAMKRSTPTNERYSQGRYCLSGERHYVCFTAEEHAKLVAAQQQQAAADNHHQRPHQHGNLAAKRQAMCRGIVTNRRCALPGGYQTRRGTHKTHGI